MVMKTWPDRFLGKWSWRSKEKWSQRPEEESPIHLKISGHEDLENSKETRDLIMEILLEIWRLVWRHEETLLFLFKSSKDSEI